MPSDTRIKPIETFYAGCRFRSRLEARWAVFFDSIGCRWEYEPQGFGIGGKAYLPDFLLVDCGTWVEVKGNPDDLDTGLMTAAALALPEMHCTVERGPRLLILGPMPMPVAEGDWAWLGLSPSCDELRDFGPIDSGHYGFGSYRKNLRPWWCGNTSTADAYRAGDGPAGWLEPHIDQYESGVPEAYSAARSARFEYGEAGR